MNKSVPVQRQAVVLRSRNLRSLVAVLLVAVAALSATVAVIAIDGDGTTTSTGSVANGRYSPTMDDPFQSQVEQPRPLGGPDESAVATAISPQTGVSAPDESKIAATLGQQADRVGAGHEALGSTTSEDQMKAFLKGH